MAVAAKTRTVAAENTVRHCRRPPNPSASVPPDPAGSCAGETKASLQQVIVRAALDRCRGTPHRSPPLGRCLPVLGDLVPRIALLYAHVVGRGQPRCGRWVVWARSN